MTHLFLNMIDPDTPLFKPPLFDSALSFIDRYFPTRKVLIHCNKGNSRAPSLALLYLAKRARVINSEIMQQQQMIFVLIPWLSTKSGHSDISH